MKNKVGRPNTYPRIVGHKRLAKLLRAKGKVFVKGFGEYIAVKRAPNKFSSCHYHQFYFVPDEKFMEEFLEVESME